MYSVADLRKNLLINMGGVPYKIIESRHTKLGRGGAVVRTKLKNLIDSSVLSKTFQGSDKVEAAEVKKIDMQYLYQDGTNLHLMDPRSYEQTTLSQKVIGNQADYLVEGTVVVALEFNGRLINIEVPNKVSLAVSKTEPGVRGDTTGTALKPAVLETGAKVKVPLFIKEGDRVVIDSRTGQYVERAK